MASRAWILGQKNFWPVSISGSSYNLPKSGAFGLRTYIPNVFVDTPTGITLADPDTKISGIPPTHPPSKEPDSEVAPEKQREIAPPKVKRRQQNPPRKRPHRQVSKPAEVPTFKPIRLTKEEIKHLPQPPEKKPPRKKRTPQHKFSLETSP